MVFDGMVGDSWLAGIRRSSLTFCAMSCWRTLDTEAFGTQVVSRKGERQAENKPCEGYHVPQQSDVCCYIACLTACCLAHAIFIHMLICSVELRPGSGAVALLYQGL